MADVQVKRGEAARQQPAVAVSERDREAANVFYCGLRDNAGFDAGIGCRDGIAQAIAQARAEGAKGEMERIEKAFDAWLGLIPTAEARAHREAIGLAGYYERGGRPEDFKAAIRARGENA